MNKTILLGTPDHPISLVELINGDQATEEFSQKDAFLQSMSEFDLKSRLNTNFDVDLDHYVNFIKKCIVEWEPKYSDLIVSICQELNEKSMDILSISKFPPKINVILSNGMDEAGAAYCRNNHTIIMPTTRFEIGADGTNKWSHIFPHELFHIISRNNPLMRDKLYAKIGFEHLPNDKIAELPPNIAHLKITNPDAPITKHYIELSTKLPRYQDKILRLAPVLVASKQYDLNGSRSFFDYLQTRMGVLNQDWKIVDLIEYPDLNGFYEKVGSNTQYIIHPEEILADNYVLLLKHQMNVPSPHVLHSMLEVLKK